jgi:FimV-like protein
MDMGDQDGARQIFEEVVAGGTDTQREEARSLIESLD